MHKTLVSSLFVLAISMVSVSAFADLELPRLSPGAKVSQTVGLTDIAVEYSSPGVRGRKIWGTLVPYGEVWRTGANAATKITFSKDVSVGGANIPAGTYALFAIPQKTSWTIIFNKDFNQGGAFNYKKDLDVARVDVKPQMAPMREHLAYIFSDFNNGGATLDLEWEKVRVPIAIKTNTDAQAAANIKAAVDGAWMPYNQAARYMLEQSKDYEQGLKLVDQSLAIKEDWLNVFTKAQLLAAKGHYKEALPLAEKAKELGDKAPRFFYADEVKKALAEWKNK